METVVFIHKGYSWYLPYTLNQASSINSSNVTLISDIKNTKILKKCNTNNFLLEKFENENINEFKKIYKHMSSNNKYIEMFCYLRWFYLTEYMKQNKINSVFYFDSDMLLYSPLKTIKETYNLSAKKCGFSIPLQDFKAFNWTASAHVSYWTYESLKDFCNFTLNSFKDKKYMDLYKEKWNWHTSNNVNGGICDMTTLYLYWRENKDNIANFLEIKNNTVFDDNAGQKSNYTCDEYLFDERMGLKQIKLEKNTVILSKKDQTNIQAHGLHFQGKNKKYIPAFYTGKKIKKSVKLFFYVFDKITRLNNAFKKFHNKT